MHRKETIMNLRNVTITTPRLRLVPIGPEHTADIFVSFTDRVARYTWPQPSGNIADTEGFISSASTAMERGEELQFVALDAANGDFIGCAGLHHLQRVPEPGIWLKESSWGKGFGLEIVSALKDWADANLEYDYLEYPVAKENIASRKIPEHLNGILESGETESQNAKGDPLLMVMYHIPRSPKVN